MPKKWAGPPNAANAQCEAFMIFTPSRGFYFSSQSENRIPPNPVVDTYVLFFRNLEDKHPSIILSG
jgi:hypothetical protein